MSSDQNYMTVILDPDFSLDSHAKDHERFTLGFNTGFKRVKALVGEIWHFLVDLSILFIWKLYTDFERRDDDELGFRKNDIITVVNSKDEHCWIGELNGLR